MQRIWLQLSEAVQRSYVICTPAALHGDWENAFASQLAIRYMWHRSYVLRQPASCRGPEGLHQLVLTGTPFGTSARESVCLNSTAFGEITICKQSILVSPAPAEIELRPSVIETLASTHLPGPLEFQDD